MRPIAAGLLAVVCGMCQIPPDSQLSPTDAKLFQQEIHRLEHLLETAGDKDTVMVQLAGTWASGGQYRHAMEILGKVVDRKVGLDPSNDVDFAKLRGTGEFEELLRKVRDDTPPVAKAHRAFTVDQADLASEGIAWDPLHRKFYLGSMYKAGIVACTAGGHCAPLVREGQPGLTEILGVRADPNDGTVWAAGNGDTESAVWHFAASNGKPIGKYALARATGRHTLNDLVVSRRGDVFVTDTHAGMVYRIEHGTDRLAPLNPALRVPAANGIAISDDGRYLYVAGFGDGITVVDLKSGAFRALAHPADLCLASIDGLYFYRGSLIAVQNGMMANRVIRGYLTPGLDRVERFEILERRNPNFEGITTGAIADGAFYFMANTQIDKVSAGRIAANAELKPIQVLKIGLTRASTGTAAGRTRSDSGAN